MRDLPFGAHLVTAKVTYETLKLDLLHSVFLGASSGELRPAFAMSRGLRCCEARSSPDSAMKGGMRP